MEDSIYYKLLSSKKSILNIILFPTFKLEKLFTLCPCERKYYMVLVSHINLSEMFLLDCTQDLCKYYMSFANRKNLDLVIVNHLY